MINNNSLTGYRRQSQTIGPIFAENSVTKETNEKTPLVNNSTHQWEDVPLQHFQATAQQLDNPYDKELDIHLNLGKVQQKCKAIQVSQQKRSHWINVFNQCKFKRSSNSLEYDQIFKSISLAFIHISRSLIALYNNLANKENFDRKELYKLKGLTTLNIDKLTKLAILQDIYFAKYEEPDIEPIENNNLFPNNFISFLCEFLNKNNSDNQISSQELSQLFSNKISKDSFAQLQLKVKKIIPPMINNLIKELSISPSKKDTQSLNNISTNTKLSKEQVSKNLEFIKNNLVKLDRIKTLLTFRDERKSISLSMGRNIVNTFVIIGIICSIVYTVVKLYQEFHPASFLNDNTPSKILDLIGSIVPLTTLTILGILWNKLIEGNMSLRHETIMHMDTIINSLNKVHTAIESLLSAQTENLSEFYNNNPVISEEIASE